MGCLVVTLLLIVVGAYLAYRLQDSWAQAVSLATRVVPESEVTIVRMLNARDPQGMRSVAGPELKTSDARLAEVLSEVRKRCGFVTHALPNQLYGAAKNPLDPQAEIGAKLEVRGRNGVARFVEARIKSFGGGWKVVDLIWAGAPDEGKVQP